MHPRQEALWKALKRFDRIAASVVRLTLIGEPSRFFASTERFWLNLQNEIDVRNRREELTEELDAIHPVIRTG